MSVIPFHISRCFRKDTCLLPISQSELLAVEFTQFMQVAIIIILIS